MTKVAVYHTSQHVSQPQIILTLKPIFVAEVQVIWAHRTSVQVPNQIPLV